MTVKIQVSNVKLIRYAIKHYKKRYKKKFTLAWITVVSMTVIQMTSISSIALSNDFLYIFRWRLYLRNLKYQVYTNIYLHQHLFCYQLVSITSMVKAHLHTSEKILSPQ